MKPTSAAGAEDEDGWLDVTFVPSGTACLAVGKTALDITEARSWKIMTGEACVRHTLTDMNGNRCADFVPRKEKRPHVLFTVTDAGTVAVQRVDPVQLCLIEPAPPETSASDRFKRRNDAKLPGLKFEKKEREKGHFKTGLRTHETYKGQNGQRLKGGGAELKSGSKKRGDGGISRRGGGSDVEDDASGGGEPGSGDDGGGGDDDAAAGGDDEDDGEDDDYSDEPAADGGGGNEYGVIAGAAEATQNADDADTATRLAESEVDDVKKSKCAKVRALGANAELRQLRVEQKLISGAFEKAKRAIGDNRSGGDESSGDDDGDDGGNEGGSGHDSDEDELPSTDKHGKGDNDKGGSEQQNSKDKLSLTAKRRRLH